MGLPDRGYACRVRATAPSQHPIIFGSAISWEGSPNCIKFQANATSDGICTQVTVTGGQMWGSTSCIQFVEGTVNPKWVDGVVISGVKMLFGIDNGANTETAISFAGGVKNVLLSGCQIESTVSGNAAFTFPTATYATDNNIRTSGNHDGQFACLPDNVTPAAPASNTPVTNNNPHDVRVIIVGGTISGYVLNGLAIANDQGSTFHLRPGDTLALVYTVAPSWNWSAVNP